MNKRRTGAVWEKVAAEYLIKNGMRVLETNFRCRLGEIDLIGSHQGYLVFVEVKYRSTSEKGYAVEAVDHRKQCRICRWLITTDILTDLEMRQASDTTW